VQQITAASSTTRKFPAVYRVAPRAFTAFTKRCSGSSCPLRIFTTSWRRASSPIRSELLCHSGHRPHAVETHSRALQRLYRLAETEHVSVAAYDGDWS
jgi:hypothetical protein